MARGHGRGAGDIGLLAGGGAADRGAGFEAPRAMYRRAAARLAGEDIPADEPLPRTKARLGL